MPTRAKRRGPLGLDILLAALVNAVVGLLIGWSGIAGFLLPMFYVGYLNLPVAASLALSFASFAVSGCIGALGYWKKGNLPVKTGLVLSAGSLAGAILGVQLNQMIPTATVKLILYAVVLASGVSILVRMRGEGKAKPDSHGKLPQKPLLENNLLLVALGFATGTVCALSGAGGPILVMPLLVVLGMPVRSAVGTALFNSIFIALPSLIGYAARVPMSDYALLLAVCCAAHGVGVLAGSQSAHFIKQKPLKTAVALFSIAIALYMIWGLLPR